MDSHSDHPWPGSSDPSDLLAETLEEDSPASRATFGQVVREIVETILLAAVIWVVINFTVARYVVEGSSMEPNLHTGQFLMVNRLAYVFNSPQRGDVIVFDYPGNPGDDYVKRVIGLPGERVVIRDGGIYIDDVRLEEAYLPSHMTMPGIGTWTVPEDSYFVLGDNRAHSSDSRSWGMLDLESIIGKAWISYWPPKYWGFVPHYTYNDIP